MRKKNLKTSITFMALTALSLSSFADAPADNTRLTDQLYRTGERFAIVLQNDSEESAILKLHGDPSFLMTDPTQTGFMSTPRKSIAYKVFYKKSLGFPLLVQESGESVQDKEALRVVKDVFTNLTGMIVNSGIFAEVENRRCTTITPTADEIRSMPKYQGADIVQAAGIAGIGRNLNLGIIHIVQSANGRSCTAIIKVPGDVGFVDDGPTLPSTTSNVNDAMSVRDRAKGWVDALIANQPAPEYTPIVESAAKEGALAVRDQASQLLAQRTQATGPEVGSKIKWSTGGDVNSPDGGIQWATGGPDGVSN
ncbi:MAG: hypothetical protein Q8S31_01950 [Alphaproteobacteria bacterium]|nr:hypothetical protein [Alphaproteobacteria bacterium]